jgi:galactose mutarotase-like enzyme
MALVVRREEQEGFEVVRVETGPIGLALIPALGGKIASLRDNRSGREWLWRHPRLPYQQEGPDASYVERADTGGWDECFPTVAPCAYPSAPWAETALPDHGELWSQATVVDVHQDASRVTLRTRWQGRALPYTFERTVTAPANGTGLRVDYAVTNEAQAPLQFIWSLHPLLRIEPGMRLSLPPSARYHRWASMPAGAVDEDSGLRFPLVAGGHDLSTLPDRMAGIALKLWSDPLPAGDGWAALQASDGELRLRWDTALLPQVGFWMNLGAWSGDGGEPYYNLGLEPCIGAQDSLAEAVTRHNLFATLAPGATRTWWLELELSV